MPSTASAIELVGVVFEEGGDDHAGDCTAANLLIAGLWTIAGLNVCSIRQGRASTWRPLYIVRGDGLDGKERAIRFHEEDEQEGERVRGGKFE